MSGRPFSVIAGRPVALHTDDLRFRPEPNDFFVGVILGVVLSALILAAGFFGWLGITVLFSLS